MLANSLSDEEETRDERHQPAVTVTPGVATQLGMAWRLTRSRLSPPGSPWIGLDTAPRAPPPCRPRRRSSCSLSFVGSFRPVLPSPSYQRQLINLDHLDHLDHLDTLPPPMPPVLSLSSFVRSSSSFVRSSKSIPLTSTSTRHLPLALDAPSRAFRVFASISSLRALHLPAGIPRASRRPSVRPNTRSLPVQGLV